MQTTTINRIIRMINIIDIIGIVIILSIAFYIQFFLDELPCPLCLLQRLGLLALAFGFLLNIRYEPRPSHYALSILAAFVTALTAMRQILLHIAPGDKGYGDAILGLHMYTWVFILASIAIVYLSIMLSIPRQYQLGTNSERPTISKNRILRYFTLIAFLLLVILIATNIISLYFECGLKECPDNPVQYLVYNQAH